MMKYTWILMLWFTTTFLCSAQPSPGSYRISVPVNMVSGENQSEEPIALKLTQNLRPYEKEPKQVLFAFTLPPSEFEKDTILHKGGYVAVHESKIIRSLFTESLWLRVSPISDTALDQDSIVRKSGDSYWIYGGDLGDSLNVSRQGYVMKKLNTGGNE